MTKKYNIVFLDIDDVLNTSEFLSQSRAMEIKKLHGRVDGCFYVENSKVNEDLYNEFNGRFYDQIDSFLVGNLSMALLRVPNVRIVLSTARRFGLSVNDWNKLMNNLRFFEYEIIDVTPSIEEHDEARLIGGYLSTSCRGYEIQQWLLDNKEVVENYCIIDDSVDMLSEQENNFVSVDPDIGFSFKDAQKVLKIFGVN